MKGYGAAFYSQDPKQDLMILNEYIKPAFVFLVLHLLVYELCLYNKVYCCTTPVIYYKHVYMQVLICDNKVYYAYNITN